MSVDGRKTKRGRGRAGSLITQRFTVELHNIIVPIWFFFSVSLVRQKNKCEIELCHSQAAALQIK